MKTLKLNDTTYPLVVGSANILWNRLSLIDLEEPFHYEVQFKKKDTEDGHHLKVVTMRTKSIAEKGRIRMLNGDGIIPGEQHGLSINPAIKSTDIRDVIFENISIKMQDVPQSISGGLRMLRSKM